MSCDKIRVSIIGTDGVPARYGGFETLVDNLISYNNEFDITVYCSKKNKEKNLSRKYKKSKLKYLNISANGIYSIIYDILSMLLSLNSNIMLILGISGALILPIIKLIYKGKIITNIDGIEWKREKWNKIAKLYLRLSERIAIKNSHSIIADNKAILEYIKSNYSIFYNKACLIEYGGDHVHFSDEQYLTSEIEKKYKFIKDCFCISVCRIEPENNIDQIIKAFLKDVGVKLVIVGNWNNSNYGKKLYNKYNSHKNLILLNPIYNLKEICFLRAKAKFYIHGHSAGGTNPSLVEAMNLGLPVLAYDCVYNRETTENQALYWGNSVELEKIISNITDTELEENAASMLKIAMRRYRWEDIAKKYFTLFFKFNV